MSRLTRRRQTGVPIILLSLLVSGGAAPTEMNLVFGVYASDTPSAMVAQTRPTLDLVEQRMTRSFGEKVRFFPRPGSEGAGG